MTNQTDVSILQKKTNLEKLILHIQSDRSEPIKCPKLQEIYVRIMHIDQLARKYKTRNKVIAMHMHRFGCSQSTANRDYKEMTLIFSKVKGFEKEYERTLIMEWIKEMAAEAAASKKYKEFNSLMKTYHSYGQFDEKEIELPQVDLEPHELILTNDVTILGLEKDPNLEAKKKKLKEKRLRKQQGVEDVEYEELPDEN